MSTNDWLDIHKNTDGKDSIIYKDSLGQWNGIVLRPIAPREDGVSVVEMLFGLLQKGARSGRCGPRRMASGCQHLQKGRLPGSPGPNDRHQSRIQR